MNFFGHQWDWDSSAQHFDLVVQWRASTAVDTRAKGYSVVAAAKLKSGAPFAEIFAGCRARLA